MRLRGMKKAMRRAARVGRRGKKGKKKPVTSALMSILAVAVLIGAYYLKSKIR